MTLTSKSIFYEWLKEPKERKKRETTFISETVAVNAMKVMLDYPHLGGQKGQSYMIYHRLGYIPRHVYQNLKKALSRVVFQQASARNLLPRPSVYEHEWPTEVNEIWAEDFTKIKVLGFSFPAAVVEDVFSKKYLGGNVQQRENSQLVGQPVEMAVKGNNNRGPKKFMLSDNGVQYVSDAHGQLLAKHEIVQKHIPAGKPQYNGTIECGMRDIKSVFYKVFAQNDFKEFATLDIEVADKKKRVAEMVTASFNKTLQRLNEKLPRPALHGVTPEDVVSGTAEEKKKLNAEYLITEQMKEKLRAWSKKR